MILLIGAFDGKVRVDNIRTSGVDDEFADWGTLWQGMCGQYCSSLIEIEVSLWMLFLEPVEWKVSLLSGALDGKVRVDSIIVV